MVQSSLLTSKTIEEKDNNAEESYSRQVEMGVQKYRELRMSNMSGKFVPNLKHGEEEPLTLVDNNKVKSNNSVRRRRPFSEDKSFSIGGTKYGSSWGSSLTRSASRFPSGINSSTYKAIAQNGNLVSCPSKSVAMNGVKWNGKKKPNEAYKASTAHARGMNSLKKREFDRAVSEFSDAIAAAPGDSKSYLQRAKTFMMLKRYEPAVDDYTKAMKLSLPNAEVILARAAAYEKMGKTEEAIEDYSTFLKDYDASPTNGIQIYLTRGKLYMAKNDLASALEDFGQVVAADPRFDEGYRQRSKVYLRMGKYELAVADQQHIHKLEKMSVVGVKKESLFDKAGIYLRLAWYQQQTFAADESNVESLISIEEGNTKQLRARSLMTCPSDILKVDGPWPWLGPCSSWPCWDIDCICTTKPHFSYSKACKAIKIAIRDYDEIITMDTTCAKAYRFRARAYQSIGHYHDAFLDFNKSFELDPKDRVARLERAAMHVRLNEHSSAMKELTVLLDIYTDAPVQSETTTPVWYAYACYGRACLFVGTQNWQKAIEDFSTFIDLELANLATVNSFDEESVVEEAGSCTTTEEDDEAVPEKIAHASSTASNCSDASSTYIPHWMDLDATLAPSKNAYTSLVRALLIRARLYTKVNEAELSIRDYQRILYYVPDHEISIQEMKMSEEIVNESKQAIADRACQWLIDNEEKEIQSQQTQKPKRQKKKKKKQKKVPAKESPLISHEKEEREDSKPASHVQSTSNRLLSTTRDEACETLQLEDEGSSPVENEVASKSGVPKYTTESADILSIINDNQERFQQILKRRRKAASGAHSSSVKEVVSDNGTIRNTKIIIDDKYIRKRNKQMAKLKAALIAATNALDYDALVATMGRVKRKDMYNSLTEECEKAKLVIDELESSMQDNSSTEVESQVDAARYRSNSSVKVPVGTMHVATMNSPVRHGSSVIDDHSVAIGAEKDSANSQIEKVIMSSSSTSTQVTDDEIRGIVEKSKNEHDKLALTNRSLRRAHKQELSEKNAEISMLREQLNESHNRILASYGGAASQHPSDLITRSGPSASLELCFDKIASVFVSPVLMTSSFSACDRIDKLIQWLGPTEESEKQRHLVVSYVRVLVQQSLINTSAADAIQVFPTGSFPLKTYLPNADIDVSIVYPTTSEEEESEWFLAVVQALCKAATLSPAAQAKHFPEASRCSVRNVTFINAEIKVVQCTINNLAVDLTCNQVSAFVAIQLQDAFNKRVGKGHLFKRSLILIKAWCLHESKTFVDGVLLGAKNGALSTYALNTMVMSLFNSRWQDISYPLQALVLFLQVYSSFDWRYNAISIFGTISIATMQFHLDMSDRRFLVDIDFIHSLQYLTLSKKMQSTQRQQEDNMNLYLVKSPVKRISIPSVGAFPLAESVVDASHFQVRSCNVIDPLNPSNNVARSVTPKSLIDIRKAFLGGKNRIAEILCSMKSTHPQFEAHVEKLHSQHKVETMLRDIDCMELDEFFTHSWKLYGSGDGYRPDLLMHPRQLWHGIPHHHQNSCSPVSYPSSNHHDVLRSNLPLFHLG